MLEFDADMVRPRYTKNRDRADKTENRLYARAKARRNSRRAFGNNIAIDRVDYLTRAGARLTGLPGFDEE
ncbi:MAG: hypothetical protein Q7U92_12295 [Bradyrhizobium sp.]|nr:hypothetical protein [Bradyrhizobium sp.]